MRDVWLIIQREFRVRARSRGFILATLFGLVAIVALNFAPSLFDLLAGGDQLKLGISDPSGAFYPRLQADLVDELPSGDLHYALSPLPGGEDEAARAVQTGQVEAALVISQDAGSAGDRFSFSLLSEEVLQGSETSRLQSAVSSAAVFVRLQDQGIGGEQADRLFAPVQVETSVLGGGAQTEQAAEESWALTYVLVLLLYTTVILYGTYLAMGVIEEKSTRVVEILISSVRPFYLMLGKVMGMALVALLQYGIWVGTGFVMLLAAGSMDNVDLGPLELEFSEVDPGLLVAFLVFFVLGFFSYAGLFAAGGSLLSRSEDAQQVTGPLSFVIVIVFFVSMYALDEPDGTVAVIFSLVPLLSPIVMFVRVAVGEPPVWQIALSVAGSLVAIVAMIALAAKVFRAGVLLYGKGMSLKSIRQALG